MKQGGIAFETLRAIRWRRWLIVTVGAPLWLGATFYTRTLPDVFQSTAVLSFIPKTGRDDDSFLAVTRYAALAEGAETLTTVGTEVGFDPEALDSGLVIEPAPEEGRLEISVRSTARSKAAQAATALAEQVVEAATDDEFVDAELVARAAPGSLPVAPPRVGMSSAALLIGLLAGVGASVIAERWGPRVRGTEDVTRLGISVLGRIAASREVAEDPRTAFNDPLVAAGLRDLRTTLNQKAETQHLKTIAVASPVAGDGATTIAGLAAEALARLGRRVLLVDADLTSPAVAQRFGLDSQRSLAAALHGTVPLTDAYKSGWVDGLSALTTRPDVAAGDLLVNHFADLLREAAADFDVVIIDCPPLLGSAEGRFLAGLADAVLLVAREGRVEESLEESLLSLEHNQANVLGFVFNMASRPFESS